MSDPQQPQVPPYASNAGQPSQPSYPPQPAPASQQHYQSQAAPQHGSPPPPQDYAQPQQGYAQPAQNYAQTAYPSPASASHPTDSNAPGRIGFIIGLVGVGLGLLQNVIIQIMIRSQEYEVISLISDVFAVIIFLAAAAALVFGVIGLKRVGAPHALAGIATGLGGAGVVGAGFNFILNAISPVLLY